MADEATLRIVVNDSGGIPAGPAGPGSPRPQYIPQDPVTPRAGRPAKPFDPYEEARRLHTAEIRREQVKDTYKQLYGEAETSLEQVTVISHKMRRTLEAVFGRIAGTALDLISAFVELKASAQAAKAQPAALPAPTAPSVSAVPAIALPTPKVPVARPFFEPMYERPIGPEPPPRMGPIPLTTTMPPRPREAAAREPIEPNLPPIPLGEHKPREAVAMDRPEIPLARLDRRPIPLENPQPELPVAQLAATVPTAKPYRGGNFAYGGQAQLAEPLPIAKAAPKPPEPPVMGTLVAEAAPEAAAGAETGVMAGLAALGPAALIAAAGLFVLGQLKTVATQAVAAVGDFATAMASPDADPASVFVGLGEAEKKAADSVFLLAPGFSILEGVVGQATASFGNLIKAVDASAAKYAEYSPVVAQAQGMAELRQVLGDIRRGQESGPALASYIKAEMELRQKYEDIKIKFLEGILPMLTTLMQAGEKVAPVVEWLVKIHFALHPLFQIFAIIQRWIGEQEEEIPNDPTRIIMQELGRAGVQGGPGIWVPEL